MRKIFTIILLTTTIAACTTGSNGEKSAGRSAENAKGVVNSIGPKLWGPGKSKNSTDESTSKKSGTDSTSESK